jgi:hypothetical protein
MICQGARFQIQCGREAGKIFVVKRMRKPSGWCRAVRIWSGVLTTCWPINFSQIPAIIQFFKNYLADLPKYLQKCRLLRRKHLNCPRFEKIPALLQVFAQNEPISRKYLHFCRFSLRCIQKEHYRINGSALSSLLGGVLLSQDPSVQVPSALEGLTVVFGMGTGGTPPPSPPNGSSV